MRRTLETSSRRVRHDDSGQITPWTVVGVLIVMILAGLVLDLGLGMSDKVRTLDLAQAAARAGAREIDLTTYRTTGVVQLDPAQATTAARRFLAEAGVPGTATASTTAVTVTIRTARRTQLLNLVGITSLPVTASATATPLTGVTTGT
jgi:Flp pilus assembly protein TadG